MKLADRVTLCAGGAVEVTVCRAPRTPLRWLALRWLAFGTVFPLVVLVGGGTKGADVVVCWVDVGSVEVVVGSVADVVVVDATDDVVVVGSVDVAVVGSVDVVVVGSVVVVTVTGV